MEDKRKTIRFINPGYDTLFTVKDGDKIRFTSGHDGEVKTMKCRWIDEAHLTLIGKHRNDYHICELAEMLERTGHRIEPISGQKPMLNILAAKYGEALADVEIPMTKPSVVKLVGGAFTTEDLRGGHVLLRGQTGVAVCKMEDDALTTVHPYWAQALGRDLGVIAAPTLEKPSILGKLDSFKAKAAEGGEPNARASQRTDSRALG